MSRLIRKDCPKCQTETIHKSILGGFQCIHCASVIAPTSFDNYRRAKKRMFMRLVNSGVNPLEAGRFITLGTKEIQKARKADEKSRARKCHEPTSRNGIFGKGKERTKT